MSNPNKKPLGLPAFNKGARITRPQPSAASASVPMVAAPLTPVVFWFIWSPGAYKPSRRHATLASATGEAARLRSRFPGEFPIYCAARVQP
jgi:hypothetical protein